MNVDHKQDILDAIKGKREHFPDPVHWLAFLEYLRDEVTELVLDAENEDEDEDEDGVGGDGEFDEDFDEDEDEDE